MGDHYVAFIVVNVTSRCPNLYIVVKANKSGSIYQCMLISSINDVMSLLKIDSDVNKTSMVLTVTMYNMQTKREIKLRNKDVLL